MTTGSQNVVDDLQEDLIKQREHLSMVHNCITNDIIQDGQINPKILENQQGIIQKINRLESRLLQLGIDIIPYDIKNDESLNMLFEEFNDQKKSLNIMEKSLNDLVFNGISIPKETKMEQMKVIKKFSNLQFQMSKIGIPDRVINNRTIEKTASPVPSPPPIPSPPPYEDLIITDMWMREILKNWLIDGKIPLCTKEPCLSFSIRKDKQVNKNQALVESIDEENNIPSQITDQHVLDWAECDDVSFDFNTPNFIPKKELSLYEELKLQQQKMEKDPNAWSYQNLGETPDPYRLDNCDINNDIDNNVNLANIRWQNLKDEFPTENLLNLAKKLWEEVKKVDPSLKKIWNKRTFCCHPQQVLDNFPEILDVHLHYCKGTLNSQSYIK